MEFFKLLLLIDYFDGMDNFLSTITVVLIVGLSACLFLLLFAYLDIKLNNQKIS